MTDDLQAQLRSLARGIPEPPNGAAERTLQIARAAHAAGAPARTGRRRRWFARRGPLLAFTGAVLAAGAALGGITLRPEAPPEIQQAVNEGLSLPAPDRTQLRPVPNGQRLVVQGTNELGTWTLYSIQTEGRGTLVTTGFQPVGATKVRPGGAIGGCPTSVLTPGLAIAPCGGGEIFLRQPTDPAFNPSDRAQRRIEIIGRTTPEVARIEFIRADGTVITGWVGNGFYLLQLPSDPDILTSASIVPYTASGRTLTPDTLTSHFWKGAAPVLPAKPTKPAG